MASTRSDMHDDPFMHSWKITKEMNKPMCKYIDGIMNGGEFVADTLAEIKDGINNKPPTAMKFRTYCSLNPTLEVHPLYTKKAATIPDYLRITFTRYRLSSHQLRIEVGRWSRTPRDQRICPCGTGIQDEFHVFQCPMNTDILNDSTKPYHSPKDIFHETSIDDLKSLHKMLSRLQEKEEAEPTKWTLKKNRTIWYSFYFY